MSETLSATNNRPLQTIARSDIDSVYDDDQFIKYSNTIGHNDDYSSRHSSNHMVSEDFGTTASSSNISDDRQDYSVQGDGTQIIRYADSDELVQFANNSFHSNGITTYTDGRDGISLGSLLSDSNLVNLQLIPEAVNAEHANLESNNVILSAGDMGTDPSNSRGMDGSTTYVEGSEMVASNSSPYIQITGLHAQTVSVPVSLLDTTNGFALLQQLGIVRIEAENDFLSNVGASSNFQQVSLNINEEQPTEIMVQEPSTQEELHEDKNISTFEDSSLHQQISSYVFQNTSASLSQSKGTRLIGSGPCAMNAEGIVQQVGGRKVTILPRPEDLKRLWEQKALVMDVDESAAGKGGGPVPVRAHAKFGGMRGGRGRRGRPYVRKKTTDDMDDYKPGGLRQGGRRRGSRGRGLLVVTSGGRRPGRPRKVQPLTDVPWGAKMIRTGPNLSEEKDLGRDFCKPELEVGSVFVSCHSLKILNVSKCLSVSVIRVLRLIILFILSSIKFYLVLYNFFFICFQSVSYDEIVQEEKENVRDTSSSRQSRPNRANKYTKMMKALARPDDYEGSDDSEPDERKPVVTRGGRGGRRGGDRVFHA